MPKDEEQHPLPTIDVTGEPIAKNDTHIIVKQKHSPRFPYDNGYALVNSASRLQTGWSLNKDSAIEMLNDPHRV